MAAKKKSTVKKAQTRAMKASAKRGARRPVRLPLVLSPKSATDAKRVRAVLGQLIDDGLLQPFGFDKAHAFLSEAHDWSGPGFVVVMPSVK
ncbi:MAG: hypothetical protein JWN44_3 [Myxococcales bacterium]|nr:hypothetical protein [Myxococcales bacterium]